MRVSSPLNELLCLHVNGNKAQGILFCFVYPKISQLFFFARHDSFNIFMYRFFKTFTIFYSYSKHTHMRFTLRYPGCSFFLVTFLSVFSRTGSIRLNRFYSYSKHPHALPSYSKHTHMHSHPKIPQLFSFLPTFLIIYWCTASLRHLLSSAPAQNTPTCTFTLRYHSCSFCLVTFHSIFSCTGSLRLLLSSTLAQNTPTCTSVLRYHSCSFCLATFLSISSLQLLFNPFPPVHASLLPFPPP